MSTDNGPYAGHDAISDQPTSYPTLKVQRPPKQIAEAPIAFPGYTNRCERGSGHVDRVGRPGDVAQVWVTIYLTDPSARRFNGITSF